MLTRGSPHSWLRLIGKVIPVIDNSYYRRAQMARFCGRGRALQGRG